MPTPSPSVARALAGALRAAQLRPVDAAGVAVARHFARLVDQALADGDAGEAIKRGRDLVAVLDALGMTPRSRRDLRAIITNGATDATAATTPAGSGRAGALAALRAGARQRRTTPVDPAPS